MQIITKKEHMAREVTYETHRAYYAQFVNDKVRALVSRSMQINDLKASNCLHFNDIPLYEWDSLVWSLPYNTELIQAIEDAGDWLSLGTGVCILKEAAKQIVESIK